MLSSDGCEYDICAPPGPAGQYPCPFHVPIQYEKEYLKSVKTANFFCWPCACDSPTEWPSMPLVGTVGLR